MTIRTEQPRFSSRAFLTRFHEFSRRRRLIEERNKIIAAISGGVDSMVMLDLLAKEKDAFGLSIIVGHFNFRMRGQESEGDEKLVAQRARHYGFEFYVDRANTTEYAKHNKIGVQEAARNLRYEFFDKLLVSSGFDKVATAHSADDNAETVLFNLFRGAGVQGLSGIPLYRQDKSIIRPLLFAERGEIELYARDEMIPFRTDSSNERDNYTRNWIRHNVVPPVKQWVNPNVVQALHRSSDLFRELDAFLSYTARQNYPLMVSRETEHEIHIAIPRLRSNPKLIQQYIVMLTAETFAHRKLDYEQVNSILDLTEGLTGSWVSINKDYVVFRDRENLVLRKTEQVPDFKITVQPNRTYEFGKFRFSSQVLDEKTLMHHNGGDAEFVDADRVKSEELVLRSWTDGDAFVPLGMTTKKKISDFFVDAKIPIYQKHQIPILETRNGEVVWVCGQRIDDRFKITTDTKRVMKLQFSTSETTDAKGDNG